VEKLCCLGIAGRIRLCTACKEENTIQNVCVNMLLVLPEHEISRIKLCNLKFSIIYSQSSELDGTDGCNIIAAAAG
jgi:hypothetical protein